MRTLVGGSACGRLSATAALFSGCKTARHLCLEMGQFLRQRGQIQLSTPTVSFLSIDRSIDRAMSYVCRLCGPGTCLRLVSPADSPVGRPEPGTAPCGRVRNAVGENAVQVLSFYFTVILQSETLVSIFVKLSPFACSQIFELGGVMRLPLLRAVLTSDLFTNLFFSLIKESDMFEVAALSCTFVPTLHA